MHNIFITTTLNNTIISVTDLKGNALYIQSCGKLGFKKSKRSTGYASEIVIANIISYLYTKNITKVNVILNGITNNRKVCMKLLRKSNLLINSLQDKTSIPYNGCKAPARRRI